MTTRVDENLLDWLRDAHAMEEQAEKMLAKTADRLEHYPELREHLTQHAETSRLQAQLVRGCIERLGGDTSAVKDATAKIMATAQSLSGLFVSDEVVKATMASYTFAHMEIASYKALIAAAELCGDVATKQVCEQLLSQEEAMADWLSERLPGTVQKFLARDQTPDTEAKR